MNLLKVYSIALVSFFATQNSFAGSSNIAVDCVSASGRTHLTASVPGDNPELSTELTVDDKKLVYVNQYMIDTIKMNIDYVDKESDEYKKMQELLNGKVSSISGVVKTNKKVFSLNVVDSTDNLVLHAGAVPNTMTFKKGSYGSYSGKFKATLDGVDPRNEADKLPTITLSCKYEYSI